MLSESKRNSLFIEWCDYVKERRGISLNAIYKAIKISRSKGARIRMGQLNASETDLTNLVLMYTAELLLKAQEAGLPIEKTTLERDATIARLKRTIARLEDENRELRDLLP